MPVRKTPRRGTARELGTDVRDIPSGLPHIGNAETHQHKAAVPAKRIIPAMNEHGVADADPDALYDTPEAGKIIAYPSEKLGRESYAVPVYDVGKPGKAPVHRAAMCDNILVPASGSDPIQICGRDYGRIEIQLLNEDAANDIRVSDDRSALLEGRGALLPHAATSYRTIVTQDELYAVGATNACLMSVIRITEVNN